MPHQCIHCGQIYADGSSELIKGCPCGSHFFFFFRKEHFDKVKEEIANLSQQEKKEMENEIRDIIGDTKISKPVILDFESIRVKKPGKFEIDLVKLFKGNPVVYKLEEGKYIIDLSSTFKMMERNRNRDE